jgi:hypothetical protein
LQVDGAKNLAATRFVCNPWMHSQSLELTTW